VPGFELRFSATELFRQSRGFQVSATGCDLPQQPCCNGIEVAQFIGLQSVGENGKQQVAGQMRRRLLPEQALPARPQAMEIEIAHMRDLVV
jgi:hypothetical protein